jgi:hypothetical protein
MNMKTLVLSIFLVLSFSYLKAQTATATFTINLDGSDLKGLLPIEALDFKIESSQTAAAGLRLNGSSSELDLKRLYNGNSDWQRWIKDATTSSRAQPSQVVKPILFKVSITDPNAGNTNNFEITKKGEAYPVSYRIDQNGIEVLRLKISKIEFK